MPTAAAATLSKSSSSLIADEPQANDQKLFDDAFNTLEPSPQEQQQQQAARIHFEYYPSDTSDTIPAGMPVILDVAVVKGKRGLGIGLNEKHGGIFVERLVTV